MLPIYETDEPVTFETAEGVACITLNRPKYGNAQNGQLIYALDAAWRRAADNDDIGAIVIRGAGKNFSSGHDIGTPGRDADEPRTERQTFWPNHSARDGAETAYIREQELYLEMCRRWRACPKPAIAAVQGACIAGGLMVAWACDLIVACHDAFFSDPVLQMGIPGVEYFAHAFEMHPRIAREFLYLGERMTAERAYQLGMVNRVVSAEQLEAEALAIAKRIASLPRFGVTLAKQAFNAQEDLAGKRATMEAVFPMHHLGHAHNLLLGKNLRGGVDSRAVKSAARETGDRA
ncbi:enoyl-CoA hydratase [Novosphingobium sp. ERN07]|uniref:enoyl-CoA hydratase n=1 Tax=Novosphingobium sp. ERN07 TaxID=2726187 RepID=UPI0014576094|nr:enoyl-CoA hydratase [Novosphingobium sp. ERN07]NLR73182.1 enoyl-CoA hydratase [Novosphingobium sp. ERN07]